MGKGKVQRDGRESTIFKTEDIRAALNVNFSLWEPPWQAFLFVLVFSTQKLYSIKHSSLKNFCVNEVVTKVLKVATSHFKDSHFNVMKKVVSGVLLYPDSSTCVSLIDLNWVNLPFNDGCTFLQWRGWHHGVCGNMIRRGWEGLNGWESSLLLVGADGNDGEEEGGIKGGWWWSFIQNKKQN